MNSSDPPRDWIYVDRINTKSSSLYISKRLSRGMQFYVQAQNIFNNKRLRSTSGTYRDSLHMWFEDGDQKGDDKIGEYDKEAKPHIYLETFDWRVFLPEKRM